MTRRLSILAFAAVVFSSGTAADFPVMGTHGTDVQSAIDRAAESGGGRVVVRAGVYDCATLYLKDDVTLHLEKGAVLLGSPRWADYDDVDDPCIGKVPERSKKAFLVAIGRRNVAIDGEGAVDGQGVAFYDTNVPPGRQFGKPAHPRPRMAEFIGCRNVRVEGVEFRESPGWTFWFRNCRDVTCARLRIHGDQRMVNNDGLHFDGCSHIRVGECDICTGDDCVVMRANRMPGRSSLCEDIVVSNCTLNSACQAVRLGCPSDDTIRNGLFSNIRIGGNNGIASIHPKRYLQPGCEGYCQMENLRFENCEVDVRGAAILFTVDSGIRLRKFGNVVFDGLVLKPNARVVLDGTADTPLENVMFRNVRRCGEKEKLVRVKSDSWEAD